MRLPSFIDRSWFILQFIPGVIVLFYAQLPNSQCDNRVLLWLVRKVGDWKFLARWLGLQESDITQVEMDNPRSGREQCYQMLLKWKSVAPESYSYPVLGEALRQESLELFNAYVKEVHRVEG